MFNGFGLDILNMPEHSGNCQVCFMKKSSFSGLSKRKLIQ